jgi:hypothetical protein
VHESVTTQKQVLSGETVAEKRAYAVCSRAFSYIVAALEGAGTKTVAPASAWICRCSAVEVYNDTCIDLLAPKHDRALLNTREDPTLIEVSSADPAAISTLKKTMQALAPPRPFFLFKGVTEHVMHLPPSGQPEPLASPRPLTCSPQPLCVCVCMCV